MLVPTRKELAGIVIGVESKSANEFVVVKGMLTVESCEYTFCSTLGTLYKGRTTSPKKVVVPGLDELVKKEQMVDPNTF